MEACTLEAGRGLRLMFWGELLFLAAVFCILLSILAPIISTVAQVVAGVSFLLSLFGLVTAARAYAGYQGALFFLVVSIILWAAINWVENSWASTFLNIAYTITNLLMVTRVCVACSELLREVDPDGARQSTKVRMRYLTCSVVSVACFLADCLPGLGALTEIVWFVGVMISLFAGLIYLLFLHDVQELMRE
ncbi:MAG: hypothetical protein ACI4O5_01935 [Oscillospiraceae bacterium]